MKRVFRSELRLAASLSCIEPILFSPFRACGKRRDFCVCDARNIRQKADKKLPDGGSNGFEK